MKKITILVLGIMVIVLFVGITKKDAIVETVDYFGKVIKMTMFFAGIPTKEDKIAAEKEAIRTNPATYFSDQKIIDFCLALKNYDLQKADQLLKEGIDINTIGKDGMTPFYFWWYANSLERDECSFRKTFKYFLEKGANPLMLYKRPKRSFSFVLKEVVYYADAYYLDAILKYQVITSKNLGQSFEYVHKKWGNIVKGSTTKNKYWPLNATLDVLNNDIAFKKLLHHLVQHKIIDKNNPETFPGGYYVYGKDWDRIYFMLKEGLTYKTKIKPEQKDYDLIKRFKLITCKDNCVGAVYYYNEFGEDYRQKTLEILEERGEKVVHPVLPKNEKYVKENGRYILYVDEGIDYKGDRIEGKEDKWIKFINSSLNKHTKEKLEQKREKRQKELEEELKKCEL